MERQPVVEARRRPACGSSRPSSARPRRTSRRRSGRGWSSWSSVDMASPPVAQAAADRLERQLAAVHGGAADRLDDPLGVGGRDLDEREALEHADVADRLAVEPAAGGDRGDQLARLQARRRGRCWRSASCSPSPLAARRRRAACGGGAARSVDLRRGDVRALGPRRDLRARVALDRLEVLALARLDERDRAAGAPDAAGAADAVHVDVGRGRHVEVDDVRDRRRCPARARRRRWRRGSARGRS